MTLLISLIFRTEPFDFRSIVGGQSFRYSGSCQASLFWHTRKSSEALTVIIQALEDAGSRQLTPRDLVRWNLQDISLSVRAPTGGALPLSAEDASQLLIPLYKFLRDQEPRLDRNPCTGNIEYQGSRRIDFAFEKKPYTMKIVDITPALHITAIGRPDLPLSQVQVEQLLTSTATYLASPQFDPSFLVPDTQEYGAGFGSSHLIWDWTLNRGAQSRLTWAQSKIVLNSITTCFRQNGWRYADIIVQTTLAGGGWNSVAEVMFLSDDFSSAPTGLNESVPLAFNMNGSVQADVQSS